MGWGGSSLGVGMRVVGQRPRPASERGLHVAGARTVSEVRARIIERVTVACLGGGSTQVHKNASSNPRCEPCHLSVPSAPR